MNRSHADERFRKTERLRRRDEFRHVHRRGRRATGKNLIVYAVPNALDRARLGLTVSGKVGKAFRRNRWKRRLREIFRRNKADVPRSFDYVVIVKKSAATEPAFDALRQELLTLMNDAAQKK